jgi:cytochrome bd-type quinol oxidase subunit 1
VSAAIKAPQVLTSIILFSIIYIFIGLLFLLLLARLIRRGPTPSEGGEKGLVEKWQPVSLKGDRQTKA